jgi:energy-coupling factor transporter ATP-binding protein EcfA2
MLLGLDRREIEARLPAILDFAEIGDFIDQPVKTYSSGMYVRLGFAVAVAVNPDVLLIDEVLSVGDASFMRRCLDRLARMRQAGVTMVLVSHDLELVERFADRAIYLESGRVRALGPVDTVVERYRRDATGAPEVSDDGASSTDTSDRRRWGNGDVEIDSVELVTEAGPTRLVPSGTPCRLVIRYRAQREIDDFVFGVAWHGPDGTLVAGHNTQIDQLPAGRLDGGGEVSCVYTALDLAPGSFLVDVAVHSAGGQAYDYWCDALRIEVTSEVEYPGVWAPPHGWQGDRGQFE